MAPYSNRQLYSVGDKETSNKKIWHFWNKIERGISSNWKDNIFFCQINDAVISDNIMQQHMTVWAICGCREYKNQITALQDWMLNRRTWRWRQCQPFRGPQFLLCMICDDKNKNGKLPVNLNAPTTTTTPPPQKNNKVGYYKWKTLRVQSGLFALPSACDLLVSRTSVSTYLV